MATYENLPHRSDKLLRHVQIVSIVDGDIKFLGENLKNVLGKVDPERFSADVSLAFLAVIGPPHSGKTVLTNFLLEFLTANQEGGWLTQVVKKNSQGDTIKRFRIGNESSSNDLNSNNDATDGIYLWPELFHVDTFGSKIKKAAWVLQICSTENENNLAILEQLLVLMCSRILEIRWTNHNIRLLDHIHVIEETDQKTTITQLCKSFLYVVRFEKYANSELGASAVQHILKHYQYDIERLPIYENILNDLDFITLCYIKDDEPPLENVQAIFGRKKLLNKIKNIIEDMMDQSEIIPKMVFDNTYVTLESMFDFLKSVVKTYKEQKSTERFKQLMSNLATQNTNTVGSRSINVENTSELLVPELLQEGNYKENPQNEQFSAAEKQAVCALSDKNSVTHDQSIQAASTRTLSDNVNTCRKAPKPLPRTIYSPNQTMPPIPVRNINKELIDSGLGKNPKQNQTPDLMDIDDEPKLPFLMVSPENNVAHDTDACDLLNRMSLEVDNFTNSSSRSYQNERSWQVSQQTYTKQLESLDNSTVSKLNDNIEGGNFSQELIPENIKDIVRNWVDTKSKLKTHSEVGFYFTNISQYMSKEMKKIAASNAPIEEHSEIIGETVLEFMVSANRLLGKHGFLLSDDVLNYLKVSKEKITKHLTPGFSSDMVCIAIDNLTLNMVKHNDYLVRDVEVYVINTYHEEMRKYFSFGPMREDEIDLVHDKLAKRLIACTIQTFFPPKFHADNLREWSNKINQELDRELDDIKLERLNFALKKVMLSVKTQYNNLITDALAAYEHGLEPRKLDQVHENVKFKIVEVLSREIILKVRENEPIEEHKLCILNYIENYWPAVVEANELKLKSNEYRSHTLPKSHKDDLEISGLKRRNSQRVKSILPHKNVESVDHGAEVDAQLENPKMVTNVASMIFHLQCPNISIAMEIEGKTKLLPNINGEAQTPACVALTLDQKFIYGTEALEYSRNMVNCKWFWCIEEFFQDVRQQRKFFLTKKGEREVTDVFLLAFLMRVLKNAVENKYHFCVTSTVAVVPMRISESQKNRIQYAGKIAGFSKIRLVSEPFATAFSFSRDPDFGDTFLMVLCESLGYIEVLLYHCTSTNRTCELLGIDGNCVEKERLKSTNRIQLKFKILSSKPSLDYRKTKAICKNALKIAEQKAKVKIVPTAFFCIVGEKENWGEDLEKLKKEMVQRNNENLGWKALLVGGVEFSKCHDEDEVFAICKTVSHGSSGPFTLSDDVIVFSKSVLDDIITSNSEEQKRSADEQKQKYEELKKVALSKIETMMVNIDEGCYNIRSPAVKTLVMSKVRKAKVEILKENPKIEDIQAQMVILENICSKYACN